MYIYIFYGLIEHSVLIPGILLLSFNKTVVLHSSLQITLIKKIKRAMLHSD